MAPRRAAPGLRGSRQSAGGDLLCQTSQLLVFLWKEGKGGGRESGDGGRRDGGGEGGRREGGGREEGYIGGRVGGGRMEGGREEGKREEGEGGGRCGYVACIR